MVADKMVRTKWYEQMVNGKMVLGKMVEGKMAR